MVLDRVRGLMLVIGVVVVVAGCSEKTTGATDVTAASARLTADGSCDSSCYVYFRYRPVGTSAWTQTPQRLVPNAVNNVSFYQEVFGLTASSGYAYQVCGKQSSSGRAVCVGPNADPSAGDVFSTPAGVALSHPGVYSWTVPAGTSSIRFDLYGAQGGAGLTAAGVTPGGLGAHVKTSLTARGGETLTLTVGGQGHQGQGGSVPGGAGGFPGGGSAGGAGSAVSGGGGGGSSDVRSGPGDNSGLSTRLIVAGAGGGGADGAGGAGGTDGVSAAAGTVFSAFSPNSIAVPAGGAGGTQSAGGAGGNDGGRNGTLGAGGDGGSNTYSSNLPPTSGSGGGGGAGGYYGGGGGSSGYHYGNEVSVTSTGGGGGSSLVMTPWCSPVINTGVQNGSGLIIITYNPSPQSACGPLARASTVRVARPFPGHTVNGTLEAPGLRRDRTPAGGRSGGSEQQR